jgi:hypothetical protein
MRFHSAPVKVNLSFIFKSFSAKGLFYIELNNQIEPIENFAISISAKTAAGRQYGLVQHTQRRDQATATNSRKAHFAANFVTV